MIEVPKSVVANLEIGAVAAGPATRAAWTTVSGVGTRSQVAAYGNCCGSPIAAVAAGAAVAVAGLIDVANSVVAKLEIGAVAAGPATRAA